MRGGGEKNVGLAADLTGWTIKVVQEGGEDVAVSSEEAPEKVEEKLIEVIGESNEETKE